MSSSRNLEARYRYSIELLGRAAQPGARILDLGVPNALAVRMREAGYIVDNTTGENLDDDTRAVSRGGYDAVTAFEIFEHMMAPYNVLKAIEAPVLVATVPLKLWFKNAYWNPAEPFDCHYHEFEPRQFMLLLARAGWKPLRTEYLKDRAPITGIRPMLRRMVPRYMGVVCNRAQS